MPNYQNGKIYKITGTTDEGVELTYIGSTTLSLCQRLAGHKNDIKNNNNNPSSKQVILCNDCLITLIELFLCNSKEELLARELYYYDLYDCVNKRKPIRFKNQQNTKITDIKNQKITDIRKQKMKEYYIENKDKLKQQRKQNYIKNKEQINEYYIANKDKLTKQMKDYYIQNKDKLKQQRKQNVNVNVN